MVPVLTMRLVGKSKLGTSVGAVAVVLTTIIVGGNLGGGAMGFPLIVMGAVLIDIVIKSIEGRRLPRWSCVAIISFAAMSCNLLCFTKKLLLPEGLGMHLIFSYTGFWFRLCSYAFWGLLSGLIACFIAYCYISRNSKRQE